MPQTRVITTHDFVDFGFNWLPICKCFRRFLGQARCAFSSNTAAIVGCCWCLAKASKVTEGTVKNSLAASSFRSSNSDCALVFFPCSAIILWGEDAHEEVGQL